jgi:hypothetical protein
MNDDWLNRRLRVVDEPVMPEPRFADDLYAELASDLGLAIPVGSRPQAPDRTRSGRRSRRWLGLLLVAAVVVGGGVAAAAGVGGFLHRTPVDETLVDPLPHVCALITQSEISAIVGAPAILTVPESSSTTATYSVSSCVYEYDVSAGSASDVILSITRYADPSAARAQIQAGILAHGLIPGLGDAATYVVPGPFSGLLVLKGADVLSIGGLTPVNGLDQMEAMAQIIVPKL